MKKSVGALLLVLYLLITTQPLVLADDPVIGEIRMWAGSAGSPPPGWATCDGFAASRTTYSALYAVLGDAYGSGDGSTTFNLPDFRGRGPMGYKQSDADFGSRGFTGGAKTHTLAVGELPPHTHGLNGYVYTYLGGGGSHNWSISGGGNNLASIYPTSQSTGSGTPVAILDPYLTINFIIYTGVGGPTPTPTATPTITATPLPVGQQTGPITGTITGSLVITQTLPSNAFTTTLSTGNEFVFIRGASYGEIIAGAGGTISVMVLVFYVVFRVSKRSIND